MSSPHAGYSASRFAIALRRGVGRVRPAHGGGRVEGFDARVVRVEDLDFDAAHAGFGADGDDEGAPARVVLGLEGPEGVLELPDGGPGHGAGGVADDDADVDLRGGVVDFGLEFFAEADEVVDPGQGGVGVVHGGAEGFGEAGAPLERGLEDVAFAPFVEGVDEEEVFLAAGVGVHFYVAHNADEALWRECVSIYARTRRMWS